MNCLVKKMIAECIGTFVLVAAAVGTAIASGGDLVATALAFGLVIVAMAYSIGRISGCHINPAVSLGCLLAKKMTVKEFLCYCAAQVVGGILGGVVLFLIIKLGLDVPKAYFATAGSNHVVNNFGIKLGAKNVIATLLFEIIATLVFVYTILNVTDEKNTTASKFAGIIIGLTLTLVHLVGIKLTGTSVNPARSIGTAVADAIFSGKVEALKQVWMFIVAPLAGGALAAVLYCVLNVKECKCCKCEEKSE